MAVERGGLQDGTRGRGARRPVVPAHVGVDSAAVLGTIDAYSRRYEGRSGRIFSEGDGHTPVLAAVADSLRGGREPGRRRQRTVVEAGAGTGDQAIHLATDVSRVNILAVEPNADKTGIHDNLAAASSGFKDRSRVRVVEDDVTTVLAGLKPGSVDAVHAHSLLHLWGREGRTRFLEAAHDALADGGTLGVSFKADGDAQQRRAKIVGADDAGVYGQDPVYSGLVRLFVSDPRAIVKELEAAGFEAVGDNQSWSVDGYDFKGEAARFEGFVARKVGKPS